MGTAEKIYYLLQNQANIKSAEIVKHLSLNTVMIERCFTVLSKVEKSANLT